MTKYQVRANIVTTASIELGDAWDYDIFAEVKSVRKADEIAKETYDRYLMSGGNVVHNYTTIDIVDAKTEDLIQRYPFSTIYVTRKYAEECLDAIIDSNAKPITIFSTDYPASRVLKYTDSMTYEEALNMLVSQAKQVII